MSTDIHIPIYQKRCRDSIAWENELKVYRMSLSCTPRLIRTEAPDLIEVEYIDALPYLDAVNGFDPQLLAITLSSFHQSITLDDMVLCHHDNQPGNILYNGVQYWFIDFSDSMLEYPEHDISHLLLFWAEEFESEKFCVLCHNFLDTYQIYKALDPKRFQDKLQENIIRFDERRKRYSRMIRKNAPRAEQNRKALSSFL